MRREREGGEVCVSAEQAPFQKNTFIHQYEPLEQSEFDFFFKFCRTPGRDGRQRGEKLGGGNHLLLLVAVCLWFVAAEERKKGPKRAH